MGEFTKGPVKVHGEVSAIGDPDGDGVHNLFNGIVAPDSNDFRGDLCRIQSCDHIDGISRGEAKANADLIAAAFNAATAVEALGYDGQDAIEKLPEMVEALNAYLHAKPQCNCSDNSGCEMATARVQARAALPTRLAESE